MKTRFLQRRFAVVLSLAIAGLVLVSTLTLTALNLRNVHASGTGVNSCYPTAGTKTCRFSGINATANFSSSDTGSGCTYSWTEVIVSDNVVSGPGVTSGTPFVGVNIFKFDQCTYTVLQDQFGVTTDVDFKHDTSLQSASVDAIVPVTDSLTGTTSNFTIDLKWRGVGPLSKVMDQQATRSQHYVLRTHYTGDTRAAIVLGTFSDGTTNYAATPALSTLFETKGGTLDIIQQ
ncbi:MAG: hypothetical protein ACXWQR_02220 [Ktedonobacterales bacterium]